MNLKTKTHNEKEKPISLFISEPGKLIIENIEHVTEILPCAGIAMIRKLVELKLKKLLMHLKPETFNNSKKSFQELIKEIKESKLFPNEICQELIIFNTTEIKVCMKTKILI